MPPDPPAGGAPIPDTQTSVDLARRLAPGTLVAGRYRIVAQLGVGGMGVVYRARDEELGQDIALKVLRTDLGADPQWIERFRRELLLARQVTHKNVVRIHDIGESEGLRFLTMSYVEGRSLWTELAERGPLPTERAVRIVRQLALALEQAHAAGVVHRDLKPGNVLLDADDTAYVSDFGVARGLRGDGLTQAGAIVGTPDYLSPEQVAGDAVDGRSDIYALGILFHEMLTGGLPFAGESQAELLAQRLGGRPRSVRESGVEVPGWVQRVIRRCLERSPARRYQTAGEIVRDLDRAGQSPAATRRGALVGAVLVLALALGWGVLRLAERPSAPPPGGAPGVQVRAPLHAIAALPLLDETADPALAWTATGVAEMIAASLAESPELRVIEPQRIFSTLADLQVGAVSRDEHTLRQVARLLEADTVVTGSVRRAGEVLRVDLSVAAAGPQGVTGTRQLSAETPTPEGLFTMVRRLGEDLRRQLGGSAPVDTAGVVSKLPAAERAYREGLDRQLRGDSAGAVAAFERAVAADPGFAAALERLSEAYQGLGQQEKAHAAAEQASRLIAGAPSRLGYRVRARLAMLEDRPGDAAVNYEELARRYPNDAAALLDLAGALSAQGNLVKAVATLKRVTALDPADPRGWFLLGKNTILSGDAATAVNDHLVRALTLQNQLKNEPGRAETLNAMGVGYQRLGDYPRAIEKYSEAAEIRKRLGDRRGVATSLKNRARVNVAMGRFALAAPDLEAARGIYDALGDAYGQADTLSEIGLLHEGRGQYAAARKAYQDALRIRRGLGDERLLGQSYDNVGYIFFLDGEYDSALVYWQQALQLRKKVGEKGGVALSIQNMGFLQTAQGHWDEALRSFVEALERSREIDFKNAMAVSYANIGILHHYAGRYAAALKSLDEALAILKQLDDRRGLAEFTLKQAEVELELGRLDAARARLDATEPWLEETANHERSADAALLRADWQSRRGDPAAARRELGRAVDEARASHSRAALLRARIAAAAAEPTAAAAGLAKLLQEADALGDVLIRIRAGEALAAAELARGRPRPAERALRDAVKLAERAGWEAGLFRLYWSLGRILETSGDGAGATAARHESARRVLSLRGGLEGELRDAFDALALVREIDAHASAAAGAGHP